jgi:DNA-binding transcriptional MerR regulator
MEASQLQRRPLFGIGTVARLTGVKADTLRIWERRYELGASYKSPSGRRLFTQGDLEHLQLVAALVASGTRIGEIAASDRKTLELLLKSRGAGAGANIPERKSRVVFIGVQLCDWLEEHRGCLANTDALLLSCRLAEVDECVLDGVGDIDSLVVEVGSQSEEMLQALSALAALLRPGNVLVLHRFGNQRWLDQLHRLGYGAASFPPDPAELTCRLSLSIAEKDASAGSHDLGQLVHAKPRLFNDSELSEARGTPGAVACECPRHIADLVRALASFEEYSASCAVESWEDTSLHACVYAYTGQARWLMERALRLVVGAHAREEGLTAVNSVDRVLAKRGATEMPQRAS